MINEVQNATEFISNLLRTRGLDTNVVDDFRQNLTTVLCSHYDQHWFPEKPFKGSGYRCLRIVNNKMDPLLSKAGNLCGLSSCQLGGLLPPELTMWIDPSDVSYRIGEEGSIGQLFGGPDDEYCSSSGLGSDSDDSSQDVLPPQTFLGCKNEILYPGITTNMEYLTQYVAS